MYVECALFRVIVLCMHSQLQTEAEHRKQAQRAGGIKLELAILHPITTLRSE